jgi:hypothetical protein
MNADLVNRDRSKASVPWLRHFVIGFAHAFSTRPTAFVSRCFWSSAHFFTVRMNQHAPERRWQVEDKEKKRVEVHQLLETKPQHLIPSNRFDVECEIVGGTGDYFVLDHRRLSSSSRQISKNKSVILVF